MFYLPLSLFNFISLLNPFSKILLYYLLNVFILSSTIFIIFPPPPPPPRPHFYLYEIPPQVNEIKTIAYDVT